MRRTKTYIAADWDNDKDGVDTLKYLLKKNNYYDFHDAHDAQQSRDTSLYCSVKKSLSERLDMSRIFILIVGDKTNKLTKGCCYNCSNYNRCSNSKSNKRYIEFECDKAANDGLTIFVLYKDTKINKEKCVESVRNIGYHLPMIYLNDWKQYWDESLINHIFRSL